MELRHLRSFVSAVFEPDPDGTTVLVGPNGSGKTTILEAVAYLGTQRSFRVPAREAMVRAGAAGAVVRADLDREGRSLLVESELSASGGARTQVNRQRVSTRREIGRTLPVTVFSPADLVLVQGSPQHRRDLLDDALRLLDAQAGAALDELDRVLRQRAALLRQARGHLTPDISASLDVWDERLRTAGSAVGAARRALLDELVPAVGTLFGELSGGVDSVQAVYRSAWEPTLAAALARSRADDVRRGVSTTGPHRDDVGLSVNGREARTQASQGEQRSLALALRLAVHGTVAERSSRPVLLLDDVFSELDLRRSAALVRLLPEGQAFLTTVAAAPSGVQVARSVDVGQLGERA